MKTPNYDKLMKVAKKGSQPLGGFRLQGSGFRRARVSLAKPTGTRKQNLVWRQGLGTFALAMLDNIVHGEKFCIPINIGTARIPAEFVSPIIPERWLCLLEPYALNCKLPCAHYVLYLNSLDPFYLPNSLHTYLHDR